MDMSYLSDSSQFGGYLCRHDDDPGGSPYASDVSLQSTNGSWGQPSTSRGYARQEPGYNHVGTTSDENMMSQDMMYGTTDLRYGQMDSGLPLSYGPDGTEVSGPRFIGGGMWYQQHGHGESFTYGRDAGYIAYPTAVLGMDMSLTPGGMGPVGMGFGGSAGHSGGAPFLQGTSAMRGTACRAGEGDNDGDPPRRYVMVERLPGC